MNEHESVWAWDTPMTIAEEPEYMLLPPGEYEFTVKHVRRSHYDGSSKIPPCPVAEVTLAIETAEGEAEVVDRFYYCQKMRYKFSSFAMTTGIARAGDTIRFDWQELCGKKGRVRIATREYNGNAYNQADRYIIPRETGAAVPF